MTTIARLVFLTALLGLFSAPLFADGLPPSEESVCDVLNLDGVTPGLFGLCNAYCEAKDCDAYPEGEEPRSCNRLLANYERRASNSDPVMPCLQQEQTVCPCWPPESERLADAGMGLAPSGCFDNFSFIGTSALYGATSNAVIFEHYAGDGVCSYTSDLTDELVEIEMTDDESPVCLADVVALINADFGGLENCVPN